MVRTPNCLIYFISSQMLRINVSATDMMVTVCTNEALPTGMPYRILQLM